ncbi:3-hydroxyacyl-CoA dehydrogenase/enoyl-CoA hydratase family protein [Chloroflexota bacterium]
MAYQIRRVAVIGSGTMGSGLAALLAGIGLPVLLLDLPAPGTGPHDSPEVRNAVVHSNLEALRERRPAALFSSADLGLITPGNFDDDRFRLAEVDWIIEVVVERLDIKQALLQRIAEVWRPGTIVSTNTSGLSLDTLAEGLPAEMQACFLGTHFFNPPRYLKLLEVIPQAQTDPQLVYFMLDWGRDVLGKGTVLAQDTPAFIANRFLAVTGSFTVAYALANGFTVPEVDTLTGPLIGRPKSATYRLCDLIGIDVLLPIIDYLYVAAPDDPAREILSDAQWRGVLDRLVIEGWLGNKSGQGFYKKVMVNGAVQFWWLDTTTFTYRPPEPVNFAAVEKLCSVADAGSRIAGLLALEDRAGRFLRALHGLTLSYAAQMVGVVADDIQSIDNAIKWGLGHELGPFELWDALGVAQTMVWMEADDHPVAEWVKAMLAADCTTFYRRDDRGRVTGVYDMTQGDYVSVPEDRRALIIADLKAANKTVDQNSGAHLLDMGDGVLLCEFHTKANAIDDTIFAMLRAALDRLQTDFDALVIGNQGRHFSAGVNLAGLLGDVEQGRWDALDRMLAAGQQITQALRYAPQPVVTAAHGMTLGGGCEIMLAGRRIVAQAELRAGLVECSVGVVPAWGGAKELLRRVVNPAVDQGQDAVAVALQTVFAGLTQARISGSARDAQVMGYLTAQDRIVMNAEYHLSAAKQVALELVAADYIPPEPAKIWAAGLSALAGLQDTIAGQVQTGTMTAHDGRIAHALAFVLTGRRRCAAEWVDEQVILDLERAAFIELCRTAKTQERIRHMLHNNKPLKN